MVYLAKVDEIQKFKNATELFKYTARDFYHRSIDAVKQKKYFSVVLSGGNTPKAFFDTLTSIDEYRNNIPWRQILFFFGDERYVSSDDVNNNYHTAYEHLFSKIAINPDNIYQIPTNLQNPKDAAKAYEITLRKVFSLKKNDVPKFDLVYLGLGDNAHTASIMPHSDVVKNAMTNQNRRWVVALFDSNTQMERITLTPNAINQSTNIIFLVTGSDKANAVWNVLEGPRSPLEYPAQIIHSVHGKTLWYLDRDAAGKLTIDPLYEGGGHYGK